jgi:hypothetical protein
MSYQRFSGEEHITSCGRCWVRTNVGDADGLQTATQTDSHMEMC